MANPTTNFGWQMPEPTDLVTDLPADFEVFGQAVDTDFVDLLGGTTGQILSKTSNTDLDFTWIANDQGDITAVTVTSPITGGGTSGSVGIAIQDGTTSQKGAVQLENSTSSTSTTTAAVPANVKTSYDLAAAAIPKSTVTTNGDLIYGTGSSTVTRLGIGSASQVLTVAAGVPSWTTLSSGGMTLLSTTTLSGSTTTISSISQSYTRLLVVVSGINNASNSIIKLLPNASSGNCYGSRITQPGNAIAKFANGDIFITNGTIYANDAYNAVTINIDNYTTSNPMAVSVAGSYRDATSNDATGVGSWGTILGVNTITSLQFTNTAGTFTAGTVLLYGVK